MQSLLKAVVFLAVCMVIVFAVRPPGEAGRNGFVVDPNPMRFDAQQKERVLQAGQTDPASLQLEQEMQK